MIDSNGLLNGQENAGFHDSLSHYRLPLTPTESTVTAGAYRRCVPTLEQIPVDLRHLPIWCAWRLIERQGKAKPDKVPVSAINGHSSGWRSPGFATDAPAAIAYAQAHPELHGIGLILGIEEGLAGGDLDKCRDPITGQATERAAAILEAADTYTEVSPGMGGYRFLFYGSFGGHTGNQQSAGVEFYEDARFLTFTGMHVPETPANICRRDLSALGKSYFPAKAHGLSRASAPKDWRPVSLEKYPLSDYTKNLIRTGGEALDRSTSVFGACKDLLRAGVPEDEICQIICDPSHGISDAPLERRSGDLSSAMQWVASYCIPNAKQEVMTEKAQVNIGQIRIDPITEDELHAARATPRVILPDFLYSDVRMRISAGGLGKTTIALFEAITLALERDLWDRTPEKAVRTAIITREDSREILVARMRKIMQAMVLTDQQVRVVLDRILVIDLSDRAFRISKIDGDVVTPHIENLSLMVDALEAWKPDWVIFDPLVSFGVGEARVNDAEQGLIEAFRMIRNRLDCCVEGIHHSGKGNARAKTTDQYSGRGGSALADGARMVVVMQPLDPSEWVKATGGELEDGASGLVMALPKLSYTKPQKPMFIKRKGFQFVMVNPTERSPDRVRHDHANKVFDFLVAEFQQGRRYSNKDLDDSREKLELTRVEIRNAVTELKVSGRIVHHSSPGKSGAYFEPTGFVGSDGDTLTS